MSLVKTLYPFTCLHSHPATYN